MGQILSYDQTTRGLYVETKIPDTVPTAFLFYGLNPETLHLNQGWSVDPQTNIISFAPNRNKSVVAVWDKTLIGTLDIPPNPNTRIGLVRQNDQQKWSLDPWSIGPLEWSVSETITCEMVCPVSVDVGQGFLRICRVHTVVPGIITPTYEIRGLDAHILDGVLMAKAPLQIGEYNVTIHMNCLHNEATRELLVRCLPASTEPSVQIQIPSSDRVRLTPNLFPTDDFTHVAIVSTSRFGILGSESSTPISVISREELSGTWLTQTSQRSIARSVVALPRAVSFLEYWLSFDNGLSFVSRGTLQMAQVPCMGLDSIIRVGPHQWKRVVDLKPGTTILDAQGLVRKVKTVKSGPPTLSRVVHIPANALGPNLPSQPTTLTTSHRVRVPPEFKPMRAGLLCQRYRNISLSDEVMRLCHVETDAYCYLLINRIEVESWARTPAQQQQREGATCLTKPSIKSSVGSHKPTTAKGSIPSRRVVASIHRRRRL